MSEHGQEFILAAIGLLNVAYKEGIVEGDAGPASKVVGQPKVVRRKLPLRGADDQRERPQRAAAGIERQHHGGTDFCKRTGPGGGHMLGAVALAVRRLVGSRLPTAC